MPPSVPYRGIRPFRFADHSIFFAREEEAQHLLQLVAVYRGVMLYGDSGVGKSSLINAGLIPSAVGLGLQPERVRVQPRLGEEMCIRRIGIGDDESRFLPSMFTEADDDSPVVILSCRDFAERVRAITATRRVLLVFDQFEELVTLFDESDELEAQRAIATMLGALLREDVAAKLLFVFREDYLARVKSLLVAAPELVDQALRLRPPRPESLRTIIRGPFDRHPGHFDHELGVELTDRLEAALADRFGSDDVSLSEVETVCLRLWRSSEPDALLATRGVQGILEDYLGEELNRLPDDQRYAAGALLSQMVTSAGTRNVISAEDLIARVQEDEELPRPLLEEALTRLERDSKLVRRERRRDIDLYEITSEFLLPWIGRRRAELVRGREKRQFRRRLLVYGGCSLAAALLVFWAVYAIVQMGNASHNAAEAKATAEIARASGLLDTDPAGALRTALPAAQQLRNADGTARVQAIGVLSRAALASHQAASLITPATPVVAVGFADSGTRLVTVLGDGRIDTWTIASGTHMRLRHAAAARTPREIETAQLSDDGSLLAVPVDQRWSLWRTRPLRKLGPLPGGRLAFSRDGRLVAVATSNRRPAIHVFEVARGLPELQSLRLGQPDVAAVSFDGDSHRVAALYRSARWEIWDVRTGRTLAEAPTRASPSSTSVASTFSRDGRLLAVVINETGGKQEHAFLRMYDTRTGRLAASRDIGSSVLAAFSAPDRLILADRLGSVQVWKPELGAEPLVLSGHLGPVTNAIVSSDGRLIATTGADLTTRIWDGNAGELRTTLLGHSNRIGAVAFAPGGRTMVTASDDGTVRLWRTIGSDDTSLPRHRAEIGHVAFSADGGSVLTTAVDGTVFLVSANGQLRQQFALGPRGASRGCYSFISSQPGYGDWWAVAACDARAELSPSGTRLVTGQDNAGGAQLRTVGTTTSKQLGPRSAYVESALFTGPRKRWAAVFSQVGAELYDGNTGAPLRPLWKGYARPGPLAAATSANGRYLVVANREPTRRVEVWDVPARRMVQRWPIENMPRVVAINRAGTYAAVGTQFYVHIWRLSDGKRTATLSLSYPLRAIAFSPNGKTLATATDGSAVVLYDVATGKRLAVLRGHTGGVNSVEFSPKGPYVVTASDDGTVRVWEPDLLLATYRQGRTGRVMDAAFDSTGTRIVAGASDGSSDIYVCRVCRGQAALFRFAKEQENEPPLKMHR
jgi:WD40 repeat protein